MRYFYKYLILCIVGYIGLLTLDFIYCGIQEIEEMDRTWALIWSVGLTLFLGIDDIINEINKK